MQNKEFYHLLDAEVGQIVGKYADNDLISRHKDAPENQKALAFLLWFMEFYGGRHNGYFQYITDGSDDASCDIILDKKDTHGKRVFFVVQSKWCTATNCDKQIATDEILKTLNNFDAVIKNEKTTLNAKVADRVEKMQAHLSENGEVKFIFLTLQRYTGAADDNISAFENANQARFEVVDIERLKLDFIDKNYKKIDPESPIKSYYNPEDEPIKLPIEIQGRTNGNFIKIEKPFEAYVFSVRAKTLYDLFDKYGFALFHQNIRNPLLASKFNTEIEKTASDNPAFFWYYNNGITAITTRLPDTIRPSAKSIEIHGLQIINGAQTLYAVYEAYKNAQNGRRMAMDDTLLINFRLLATTGMESNLRVTRFTNSQNPITDRDLAANDPIQKRLQKESFTTKYWYETRRDEFREVPKGVEVVKNEDFMLYYLPYYEQRISAYFGLFSMKNESGFNVLFTSQTVNQKGIYEKIIQAETVFEDMLAAYLLANMIKRFSIKSTFTPTQSILLCISIIKYIIIAYLTQKYKNQPDVNTFIIKKFDDNPEILIQCIKYGIKSITDQYYYMTDNPVETDNEEWFYNTEKEQKFYQNSAFYEQKRSEIIASVTVEAIENTQIT